MAISRGQRVGPAQKGWLHPNRNCYGMIRCFFLRVLF